MKFENVNVYNIGNAIRGMRNPLGSWNKSDSVNDRIGSADIKLAQVLINAGSEHRKFMRQIFISVDITAPLYWWKQFDTYKVGTVANSTSTMHKIASTPITIDKFQHGENTSGIEVLINWLEDLRRAYVSTHDIKYWQELIRLLPESWLQLRTVTMNYENVYNMIRQREHHRLDEWRIDFINFAKSLPYSKELLFYGVDNERK